jgi:hypothetical protein
MPNRKSHSAQVRHITAHNGFIDLTGSETDSKEIHNKRRLGPTLGNPLLLWLAQPVTEAQKRIDEILNLIVELRDQPTNPAATEEGTFLWQGKFFTAKTDPRTIPEVPRFDSRQSKLRRELIRRLERYNFRPYYWGAVGNHLLLGWTSHWDWKQETAITGNLEGYTEEDAIICIVELAREGLFDHLRKCLFCEDWYFASFAHQKFCDTLCQQKHYRSSSEYKETRRAYMKELRAQHKKKWHPASTTEAIKNAKKMASISVSKPLEKQIGKS